MGLVCVKDFFSFFIFSFCIRFYFEFFYSRTFFQKPLKRKEYLAGFIGIHFLLFLILPFFFSQGDLQTLRFTIAIILMGFTFFTSLSASCRRVTDAGGVWFGPIIPVIVYALSCCVAFVFSEYITGLMLLCFFVIFSVVVLYNMYYIFKSSKGE